MKYLLPLWLCVCVCASGGELTVEVGPAPVSDNFVPVHVEITPPGDFAGVSIFDDAGERLPCQWENAGGKVVIYWIEPRLEKGRAVQRLLKFLSKPEAVVSPGVEIKQREGALDVFIGGELFTTYHFSKEFPKPFCHPVLGPSGKAVTRGFPMLKGVAGETTDHPHHRSWYFAFGAVNGIDFWAEGGKRGRIVHRAFERVTSGPVFGEICARNDWLSPTGQKIMEDVRTYRFYNVRGHRLIDWWVTLRATDGPVLLGDTKEGMAAFRMATALDVRHGGTIRNSRGGVNEKECWGKRAEWCDYFGTMGGRQIGIAFFDHPSSFRHPTYWMVRNYGLYAANPFGLKKFLHDETQDGSHRIPASGEITFSYRIYIHEGDTETAHVARKYESFAHPPAVRVVRLRR